MNILFTILPFSRSKAWWIRIFDFPRLQIAILSILSVILLFFYKGDFSLDFTLVTLLVACFVYQFYHVIRFTPFYRKETPRVRNPKFSFSILQTNVRMENRKVDRLKQHIRKYEPDIISVNEPDDWWADQLKELDKTYPYSIKKPLSNTYGMMVYSKYELVDEEVNFLVKEGVPSMYATVVFPSGQELDLHCVHPEPPAPGSPTYERDTEILLIGKRVKETDRPAIIVGDLNDVAWSYTSLRFKKFSGVVDPRQGRGLFATYNAFVPLFQYPLDHFFHTKHFALRKLKKLHKFGSDHYPMFISFSFLKK
ncbi:MAG: endonuclease/exonuclease/phosphatase family protein [Flavitalea sp.]